MKNLTDTDAFAEFICSAAKLRSEFIVRQGTLRFLESKVSNFVLHVADTNVVKTYANPALVGPDSGGGYGQIFQDDGENDATAIAAALGTFIFYHLSEKLPILQLPTHALETQTLYTRVAEGAYRTVDTISSIAEIYSREHQASLDEIVSLNEDSIGSFQGILSTDTLSREERGKAMENDLGGLVELLIGSRASYQREYVRYLKLLADGCLLSIDGFRDLISDTPDLQSRMGSLQKALEPPNSIAEWAQESERVQFWTERILEERKSNKAKAKNYAIEADARALARLEYLNEKIRPIGGRLVLITGDHGLVNAARKGNFLLARDYLLDIRAFLVESFTELLPHQDNAGHETMDAWLNGILLDYTDTDKISSRELEELINRVPSALELLKKKIDRSMGSENSGPYSAAIEKWREIKGQLLTWNLAYSDDSGEMFREIMIGATKSGERSEIQSALAELTDFVAQRFDQIWDELLISFTTAGVSLLYAFRDSKADFPLRSRNPPIIRFDSFPVATRMVAELIHVRSFDELSHPINWWLEKMRCEDASVEELGSTDYGYLSCLVFAALCSAERKWIVAKGLARRAINIAESGQIPTKAGSYISGREAHYLYAMSTRLTATDPDEFSVVRRHLDLAIKALDTDHKNNSGLTIKGYRFRAEHIATDVSEMHFVLWKDKGDRALLSKTSDQANKAFELIRELLGVSGGDRVEKIAHRTTIVNLFVNILQLAHIDLVNSCREVEKIIIENEAEFLAVESQIERDIDKYGELQRTYLINSYILLFKCILGFDSISKSNLDYHFSDLSIDKYSSVIYDENRFLSLKNICLGKYKERS